MDSSSKARAGAFTALAIGWFGLFVFDAMGPVTVHHAKASPVLSLLLALALAVAMAIAVGLHLGAVLAARLLNRSGRFSDVPAGLIEAFLGIGSSAMLIGLRVPIHSFGEQTGISVSATLAILIVVASAGMAAIVALRAFFWSGTVFEDVPRVGVWGLLIVWVGFGCGTLAIDFGEPRSFALAASWIGMALAVRHTIRFESDPGRSAVDVAALAVGVAVPCALAVAFTAPVSGPGPSPNEQHPPTTNVLMLMIDTLRADHTSLAGYARDTTPTLAAVASEGTLFSAAHAAAPSTIPSVKSLFTGMGASSWGIKDGNAKPPVDVFSLAEAFRRGGYVTGAFSANSLVRGEGFRRGFRDFWSAGGARAFQSSFLLKHLLTGDRDWEDFRLLAKLELHKVHGDSIRRLGRGWLEDVSEDPFFLYLHVVDPHWPYHERGYGFVSDAEVEPYSHVDLMRLNQGDTGNAWRREQRELDAMIARYDEEIRFADDMFARLLTDLDELGLREDTLVIVVADHGEEFFEHNGFGHGHDVFQEQVHVPLLFLWPRSTEYAAMPTAVEEVVSLVDVFPTLVDYLALPDGGTPFHGVSLRGAIEDGTWSSAAVSEAFLPTKSYAAYREGALKMRLRHAFGEKPAQSPYVLGFDLDADPAESAPVALKTEERARFEKRGRAVLRERWAGN